MGSYMTRAETERRTLIILIDILNRYAFTIKYWRKYKLNYDGKAAGNDLIRKKIKENPKSKAKLKTLSMKPENN